MLLKKVYDYPIISRTQTKKGRQYLCPDGRPVPSVTTILDQTKSEEKKQALQKWRARVGETQAAEITRNAANRGTSMHKQLEEFIIGKNISTGTNLVHQQASKMANAIIEEFLKPSVSEVWGNEVSLYYTGLYAGTTDCVGLWNGRPAIIDFKQTNKPKKVEWIEDYFLQTVFYGTAHNHIYGTDIKQGVILMCSSDLLTQKFEITDNKWDHYESIMWDRIEQFYTNLYK